MEVPEFTLEETERSDRGTDIILHVDEDCKEFLEESRLQGIAHQVICHFLGRTGSLWQKERMERRQAGRNR